MERARQTWQLAQLKDALARRFSLRWHMGLMFSLASLAGIAASKVMLAGGLTSIDLRYPLAVLASYLTFLACLRLWLSYVLSCRERGGDGGDFDFPDGGGGGANGSWTSSDLSNAGPSPCGGGWSSILDGSDEGFFVVLALLTIVAAATGCGVYCVYIAPDLLTELAFSALVGASLSSRSGWIARTFRSTAGPFLIVLVLAAILGHTVHSTCPTAVRLADAFRCPQA